MDIREAELILEAGKEAVVKALLEMDACVGLLAQRVTTLEKEIASLISNSTNSFKPPFSDGPKVARPRKRKSSRSPGGQKGHKGHRRESLPVEQMDHVHECYPDVCEKCTGCLNPQSCEETSEPLRYQTFELLKIKTIMTEYRCHELKCTCIVTTGSSITINGLANDTDADGDNLTIASLTQGTGGQSVISNNALKYTPKATFSGTDSFSYTASGGEGGSASGTVSIQVLAANKPPVANDVSISVQSGSSVSDQLLATDPDGNALRFSLVSLPSNGNASVSNASDGTFTYTANAGVFGTDSFSFEASEGKADSNTATVQVTLTESGKVVFAVNSGGPQYIDANEVEYAADTRYSGSYTASRSSAISDTVDDTL